MIYVLLAEGFEEVEALAPVDILRRGNIDVKTAGIGGDNVCGAHNIYVKADMKIEDIDVATVDGIVLPGGMPGTLNLQKDATVNKLIKHCNDNKLLICAICAAPMILGELGLLEEKNATCYPGFEEHLKGATLGENSVEVADNFITGKGPGASFEFGKAIVNYIKGEGVGENILSQMQYKI